MLNNFTKLSCEIDQFTYELILLKKFNKIILDKKLILTDITDIYKYLNEVDEKLKRNF